MKIALIGYGKMGKTIEQIAISRGHQVVSRIDIDNQEDFNSEEFKSADVASVHAQVETNKAGIASNLASINNLVSRLDGIVAQGGEPNVINTIKVNGVVQTIATDKSVDIAVPVVQALTEAEIKSACGKA